jgi:C-terminal processing protease CtpA/Prc
MLVLDNGSDQGIRGTAGPKHMDVTIYVPTSATTLLFGLLLSGTGVATAQHVRVVARPYVPPDAPLAAEARKELDAAITIVKSRSLWRDTVTWSKVEPEVRAVAAGAENVADVYPAIRLLLSRLGDHHSFLMKPQGAQSFRAGGAENPRAVVRAERLGIGYVSVPGYSGTDPAAAIAFAQSMQDSIASAIANGAGRCRWIVDLREDVGGNMWPMLGGLRPFLGDAGLGSFVNAEASQPLWHAGDQVNVPPTPALAGLESSYVAVLTGPRTASSGEAVAISFRGRPRTRSFGLPTAGLSTANDGQLLPDGAMMLLTVAVEADRTGKRYGGKLDPDEEIAANNPRVVGDPQMTRAIEWLTSQRCSP